MLGFHGQRLIRLVSKRNQFTDANHKYGCLWYCLLETGKCLSLKGLTDGRAKVDLTSDDVLKILRIQSGLVIKSF